MKKSNHLIAAYAIAVVAAIMALYFGFHSKGLKDQMTAEKVATQKLASRLALHEALLEGDSLVIRGDYNNAIRSYQESVIPETESDGAALELRMAFAKAFLELNSRPRVNDSNLIAEADTAIAPTLQLSELDINKMDSLGFALEKMRAQVSRLQKQLRKKANGQYLTFTTSKGSLVHYVGEVKNKKANGIGVALLSTGSRYEGQWKNNQRHGQGTFYWPDGQSYEGAYVNDKREGEGTYYWPNGEKYVGQWKEDERFGEGVFYGKEGDVVASGLWEDDQLVQQTDKPRRKP